MALSSDELHMRRALVLAERGRGAVEPNPMVGAVVVGVNGEIVGEGWHERFGGPHAEVNALAVAGEQARAGTLYVTLEPCRHFGKTPPCTEAILRAGVSRVTAAMLDPFPEMRGGGIALLQQAGVETTVGVCSAEAERLNSPYLKLLRTGRPWVIAKWAMSLDGKIATRTGDSKWISCEQSRALVHTWRGQVDAIVVGRGTVIADDPLLTARPPGPRCALRVVLSASGKLPEQSQLMATARDYPVLVVTAPGNARSLKAWSDAGAEILELQGGSIAALLDEFGRRKATNILVEGGSSVLGAFFDEQAIDEVRVFVSPKIIGGKESSTPIGGFGIANICDAQLGQASYDQVGSDLLATLRFS